MKAPTQDRIRAYLGSIADGVSGNGGQDVTFHVACIVVQGLHIEQHLGPQIHLHRIQSIRSFVNINPIGLLFPIGELQLCAIRGGLIAGLYGRNTLHDILPRLDDEGGAK